MEFTPCKTEQPPQDKELQEIAEDKKKTKTNRKAD